MGSLMYISCVLLMTIVPLIDSYELKPTMSVVNFCLGGELHLSCKFRFPIFDSIRSLSEVGWIRGDDAYGRINVTACRIESEACTEATADGRGVLRYNSSVTNVASVTLMIINSTLKDNATFSCFALDNKDTQTSQNISAIVHELPNKTSYPFCSIKTCSSDVFTLSCTADITEPMVSLEWIVSGTNSTEVRLSNNTVVIEDHVLLLNYNTTGRYNNETFTCRLSSDEFPCLKGRSCSIEPAVRSEECPPGEFTSVPSPFSTRAPVAQSPTGFALVMVIVITAAGAKIVIILLLFFVCFVRSKGSSEMKRTKKEGTTATSATTASTRRHRNVFEDVNLYIMPDCEQTVQASDQTPVDPEHQPGGKAGPLGTPSLTYEVVSEAVNDEESQVVAKTPNHTAQVYEVLKSDETDRATDNQGPTCGGSQCVVKTSSQTAQVYEVLGLDEMEKTSSNEEATRGGCQVQVKTPSQTAPVYAVLEPDETDRATDNEEPTMCGGGSEAVVKTSSQTAQVYEVLEPDETKKTSRSNEGATYEVCGVHTPQEKEPLATDDRGKAEEGPNKGAGSPRSFTQDSKEGELIENIWYVPYEETCVTE